MLFLQELIATQELLAQKIPGFKFNLGFSGKGFKIGGDEEDEGDEALIAHAHRFTWFGHLYNHEQAHRFSYDFLVKNMKQNEQFAKVSDYTGHASVMGHTILTGHANVTGHAIVTGG